tara:strand:- start:422 stop:757 length:336 start_codon:yes stop_codon:yes gene_type:complete
MASSFSPLLEPNCNPPFTKKDESELISLAILDSFSLLILRSKRLFNPINTAVPLLDPPPSPAFVGIVFFIKIFTLGISGCCDLSILNAFVPKLSASKISPQSVMHENSFFY